MNPYKTFRKKVKISGDLIFDTAFHIGSGREGELATDMGVLVGNDGSPLLPGSTLKGSFRALAEKMAKFLDLTACLLDSDLSAVQCVTCEKYRNSILDKSPDSDESSVFDEFKKQKGEAEKWAFLNEHTCDICRLFGSPLQASRIYFSDGQLKRWDKVMQIRDGVCIDRDTETARHGFKYDFEAVSADTVYHTEIELENPDEKELALVGAVVSEWESGFRLGGFTSRGLGRVRMVNKAVFQVDYCDEKQLKAYLLNHEMQKAENLISDTLELYLAKQGEAANA